jgi:hypothetical protein
MVTTKNKKDFYEQEIFKGDYLIYNRPRDYVPNIVRVHSFTRTGTPRVQRFNEDKPRALLLTRYYSSGTSGIIRSHKLNFIKINPPSVFKDNFFAKETTVSEEW